MKNYTSMATVNQSIQNIEKSLVKNGALNISKQYDSFGKVNSMSFQIELEGRIIAFLLPVNIESCEKVLKNGNYKIRVSKSKISEQAERTAWKIMQEWVEIQMSLIEMKQAEFLQIFFPYALTNEGQLYNKLKSNNFKLLTGF